MENFKVIMKKIVGVLIAAYSISLILGLLAILSVGEGLYVQPIWLFFGRMAVRTVQGIVIFTIAAVVLIAFYIFCRALVKKNHGMARKMLPQYRGTYDKRAKRWSIIAGILEDIFAIFFCIFKFFGECLDELD